MLIVLFVFFYNYWDNKIKFSDADQRTALHWACAKGKDTVVEALLERGANVNAVDESGNLTVRLLCWILQKMTWLVYNVF